MILGFQLGQEAVHFFHGDVIFAYELTYTKSTWGWRGETLLNMPCCSHHTELHICLVRKASTIALPPKHLPHYRENYGDDLLKDVFGGPKSEKSNGGKYENCCDVQTEVILQNLSGVRVQKVHSYNSNG